MESNQIRTVSLANGFTMQAITDILEETAKIKRIVDGARSNADYDTATRMLTLLAKKWNLQRKETNAYVEAMEAYIKLRRPDPWEETLISGPRAVTITSEPTE